MERKSSRFPTGVLALAFGAVISCAPFLVPNPPANASGRAATDRRPASRHALAGSDSLPGGAAASLLNSAPLSPSLHSGVTIRIALARSVKHCTLYTPDRLRLRPAAAGYRSVIWGRITIAMQEDGSALIRGGSGVESRVALPCTLGTLQSGATFAFNGCRYRGSMVFSGNDGTMINCVDVEDYLRSVVPSEMGKRSWQELEALKAQAVASRTYAYKRMQVCRQQPFDVVSTIADQVYGGALAETAEADSAIRSTRGLVVLWKDSLAAIYYHSTCGGQTAAIEDAWDKPSCPYLQSVSDRDPDGVPYCSFSPLFTWEERWSAGELSAIIRQNSGKKDETHFSGDLLGMSVVDRFPSGRIKTFRLAGSEDTMEVGGDRLRFILRRKSAGGALLRSSNFSIMENGPDYFSIRGCGYGHGVGMCQMGAIGRARRGERFDKILRIYFPGTEIKRIDSAKLAAR